MVRSFYDHAILLDKLKTKNKPTRQNIDQLLEFISDEIYSQYFFTDLENPAWIEPLFINGYFDQTPEPLEIKPGQFQLSDWPAGRYLVRYSKDYPDIIKNVILNSKTTNWRVQELLISAMMEIPINEVGNLLPKIDEWLSSTFSDMLPIKLIELTNHLISNNKFNESVQILKFITTLKIDRATEEISYNRDSFRFRSDPYWVNEYYQKIFPVLNSTESRKIVSLYQKQLEKILEYLYKSNIKDPEKHLGFYWRFDIPFSQSTNSNPNPIDLLIDSLRDGLIQSCDLSEDYGRDKIITYLNSDHLIFQRIALFALRKHGEVYPDLLEREMTKTRYLEDQVFDIDYRGLIRDQFGTISPKLQKRIIEFILAGPSDIDERVRYLADRTNKEPTIEDAQLIIDRWRFQHLPLIEKYLSPDELAILTSIKEKYKQEPDISERPSIEIGPVTSVQSPISIDELSVMDFQTLKDYFLTYVPEAKYMHSRDSLGRAFKGLVSNNGTKYLDFALLLIDDNIRLVYTYYYLQGLTEGIKTNTIQLVDDILKLCRYVVHRTTEPNDPQRELHEPGLDVAKGQVADLLDEVVKMNDYYLSRDQLDSLREMVIELAHHPDPTEEKEKESSMDPFTYSLNCIRGRAMHGIFDYSLYIVRQKAEQEGKERIPGFLEEPVVRLLDEKIDISIEKSPAVHSVFGAYLTQLNYLSKEWVASHLDQLFPSAPEQEIYWRAAWDGYIFGSNVVNDVFKMLIPQYQRGLKLLSEPKDEKDYWGGSPNERLAQHVMVIYLRELTDFDHENQILDLFFENAPDQIRAQAIFWLGKVLENEKKERPLTEKSEVWQRCWRLLQMRLEKAETEEVTKNGQEIANYMRWLVSAPMTLDQLYETLLKSVKYFQDRFDVMQLLDYAVTYCEQSPREAISLLRETISSAKEPWWRANEDVEEKILRAAMTSADEEARQIAIDIINLRGEQGFYKWRELLSLK